MRVRIDYTCDWSSDDDMDSGGRILVTIPGRVGWIVATWTCRGGMGKGADVEVNTLGDVWDDNQAEIIVNSADIAQT